jgi:hypothetical protein
MPRKFPWLAIFLSFFLCGAARADDELIANSDYLAWSKFGTGTSVTYDGETNMMGNAYSSTATTTLTAIAGDKITLRVETTLLINGKPTTLPPQTSDIPVRVKKPASSAGVQPADAPKTQTSSEDVSALGRKFACKKTKVTTIADGLTNWTSTWTSDEVPGGLVKSDSETTGAETATIKAILTAMVVK